MHKSPLSYRSLILFLCLVLAIFTFTTSMYGRSQPTPPAPEQYLEVRPLDEKDLPTNELGTSIRLGYQIITDTPQFAKKYAGNALSCTNCHLDAGRRPYAAPFIGLWGMFPEYRPRNGEVNLLSDRINDCFLRSLNGKALPIESREMKAIHSYIWWLSRGTPTGVAFSGRGFKTLKVSRPPDKVAGLKLFQEKCLSCHGNDGSGQKDELGRYHIPPLWGTNSFNIGAGMARQNTATAFIVQNMPLGSAGTLSQQEAADIASFVIQGERPDFPAKKFDWPKGDRPPDARY